MNVNKKNMKLEELIGKQVAIHCETAEESLEINKMIVEIGGRNLHIQYKKYKELTCYDLNDLSYKWNTYGDKEFYESHNYKIIKAKEILNKNHMKHVFKSGLIVEGTKEEIKLIAKALGESISPIYKSATKGDIPVDEMNEIHLRNAILLHLRDYFIQKNFKNLDLKSFLNNIEEFNNDVLIILINELKRRINEKN